MRLGADKDGKLTALDHHTKTTSSTFDDFFEPASDISHTLYASPAIATSHEAVRRRHRNAAVHARARARRPARSRSKARSTKWRRPAAWTRWRFGCKNYAEVEPISGKPFSSKALRECYAQGAERFGWARRPLAPRQMRDRDGLLVGWGVGTATFPALMFQAHAEAVAAPGRQRRHGDRRRTTWARAPGPRWRRSRPTALGLDIDQVEFRSGTSDLPDAGIAGGSAHTATAGMAIHNAGADVIAKLADLATSDERSPLFGAGNAGVIARGGRLHRRDDESRSESYADILGRAGLARDRRPRQRARPIRRRNRPTPCTRTARCSPRSRSIPISGRCASTRLVGAFAAGRIINPRMVRSQYYGGMIWGVSFALHEQAVMDPRSGRPMNPNFAEYHIPVNADVPSLEAILVEERDPHVNALGIKGVGEIGVTGTRGRGRQRGLARDRRARAAVSDHARSSDRPASVITAKCSTRGEARPSRRC